MEIDSNYCEHYFCGECKNDRTDSECCCKNYYCYYKQLLRKEQKLKQIKEHCNETIRVMGDTGNNPYSQGRTIEAKRVLEILGEDNGN